MASKVKRQASAKARRTRRNARVSQSDAAPTNAPIPQLVMWSDPNPLGAVTTNEIAAIVTTEYGADPALDARDTSIAVEALARVLIARMENASAVDDPKRLAIFMLTDRPRELAQQLNGKKEPIIDNGSLRLAGNLWIAGPSFASGYCVALVATETATLFDEVAQKGVGDRPAFVFDPAATEPEIRFYPNGVNDTDSVQRFVIAEKVFTLAALDRVLQVFHESNVITPHAAGKTFNPWHTSAKYIPRADAEAFLQSALQLALSVAFRRCVVRFEVRGTEGRCDLLVVSRDLRKGNAWLHHAAMELKVLRSFSSRQKPVSATARKKALDKGLLQAIAYKTEHAATVGMLCCFDMRLPRHADGNACFAPIRRRATTDSIELRRFRLYGSAEDLRRDKYRDPSSAA